MPKPRYPNVKSESPKFHGPVYKVRGVYKSLTIHKSISEHVEKDLHVAPWPPVNSEPSVHSAVCTSILPWMGRPFFPSRDVYQSCSRLLACKLIDGSNLRGASGVHIQNGSMHLMWKELLSKTKHLLRFEVTLENILTKQYHEIFWNSPYNPE